MYYSPEDHEARLMNWALFITTMLIVVTLTALVWKRWLL